jgi:signal transduction histidine kinase
VSAAVADRRSAFTIRRAWASPAAVYACAGAGVVLGVIALTLKTRHVQRVHDLHLQVANSYSLAGILVGAVGGYTFIGAGVVAYVRRPNNRVGLLMVLVGVGFFAEDVQLSSQPWVHSFGLLFIRATDGALVHLVLAFPEGRLTGRVERALAGVTYGVVFVLAPVVALFTDTEIRELPKTNVLLVARDSRVVALSGLLFQVFGVVVTVGLVAVLVRRWLRAGPPLRRVLAPVFVTGLLGAVGTAAAGFTDVRGSPGEALAWVPRVAFCLLPIGFLAGVWRVRLGRTAVGTLLAQLREPMSAAQLQAALARAVGDPSLRVGYWRPDAEVFVDGDGWPLAMPGPGNGDGDGDGVTLVQPGGRRVAVLIHDPALREDGHVLRAVAAAAELTLENQRLTAEVRAQLTEVRELAGRLVAAGDDERRRLERDLHDGAQQRLVSVAFKFRRAAERMKDTDDADAAALLVDGVAGLQAAIAELRELARGIHPAVLNDAGLLPALQSLAERMPEPEVHLRLGAVPRLPPAHEATGYFLAAEALTNTLKHAAARHVGVAVAYQAGVLRIEVTDDGVGGADLRAGSGLLGIRDRVTALGGRFMLRSVPGQGTSVAAEISCLPVPADRP